MLSSRQRAIVLTEFLDNMWGNSYLETNHSLVCKNISPSGVSVGTFSFSRTVYHTPSLYTSYAVYLSGSMNIDGFGGSKLPMAEWVKLTDLCNDYDLLIRARFKDTEYYVEYKHASIMLTTGGLLFVAVPAKHSRDKDLILDIRTSELDHANKMLIEEANLTNNLSVVQYKHKAAQDKRIVEVIVAGQCVKDVGMAIMDTVTAVDVTTLFDTSVDYVTEVALSALYPYEAKPHDNYHLLEVSPAITKDIYHAHDCRIYLEYNNVMVLIDNFNSHDTVMQVTNRHIGISANYVTTLLTELNWAPAVVNVMVYVQKATTKYIGNPNYLASLSGFTPKQLHETLIGSASAPACLSATTLHNSKFNHYLGEVRAELIKHDPLYQISEMDRLFNSAVISSGHGHLTGLYAQGLEPVLANVIAGTSSVLPNIGNISHGNVLLGYRNKLVVSHNAVDISSYTLPAVFLQNGTLGVLGTDYNVAGTIYTPVNKTSSVVDINSTMNVSTVLAYGSYSVTIPDLDSLKLFSDITVMINGVFAHVDIDYTVIGNDIVIWKRERTEIDISITPTLDLVKPTTGWMENGRLYPTTTDIIVSPETHTVFLGDVILPVDEVKWDVEYKESKIFPSYLANPYTITNRLLTNFTNTTANEVEHLRAQNKQNHLDIATYLGNHSTVPRPPRVHYNQHYYITSPFLMDILAGITDGTIPISDIAISLRGLDGCIGKVIMDKFRAGYDPSHLNGDLSLRSLVKIAPHTDTSPLAISQVEYSFLTLVNNTYMHGTVLLNEFFRVH